MENEKDNIEGGDGKRNGNIDCANEDLVISDKSSEIPSLLDENKENGDQTATIQAALTMPSTRETIPDRQVVNNLSFSSLSETKTTKRQGDAILEVAEQTTAYNIQLTSNNPTTIDVASTALQPGSGHSSIIIEKPEQVIIHENISVKDTFAVQLGHNNVLCSAQTPESEGSALVGATSAAVSQPQLVIRQPGTVLVYSRKDIEGCENVQIGDNNVMGKLIPPEDKFVKTCIKLGINPEQKQDIFERLGNEETREQFSAMMEEKCNVRCKLKNAGEGCILLELEVPTEADRLQLLRMARDGTFQQVLLETFLPELAAEGRAVNMNLAIGVRNPSQEMLDELQGAVASSEDAGSESPADEEGGAMLPDPEEHDDDAPKDPLSERFTRDTVVVEMDPAHRDILQRNRGRIVDDLNVDKIKDSLIQIGVFKDGDWEDIATAGKGTRRDKASALMDELPRRGPRAFWCFCESLMTGGYDFLGKPLIEEGKNITGKRTADVREEYRKMLRNRKVHMALLPALKKVAQFKKVRGRKVSEQKVTSFKYIKEALQSNSIDFGESEELALNELLGLVDKLKHVKYELERYGLDDESVKKLSSMLAEGADFSTLYDDVKGNIGSNYLNYFALKSLDSIEISRFGSVLVLIPYLCDISEQAVRKMGLQSFSSQGADSRRDEDVEREDLSPDTGEQDDTSSEDELDESGYMEVSSDRVSQQEDKLILTGMEELFSAQEEKIDQRFDKFEKQMDQKLRQHNEDIKASLFDVSSHLTDVKQALEEQEAMRGKVSDLQERVRDLLIHEIDQTTIKGEIKDIERKVIELKEQFQGGDQKIQDGLTQMNEQLEKMLSTLERDSMDGQQLSGAIDILTTKLPFENFDNFAQKLGFSESEINEIRSSSPGDLNKQKSELLQRWRKKQKVNKATVKALAQACRDIGLFTLADEISGISGGPSRGTLSPLQNPRGISDAVRKTWPIDSKAASGAIPKKKK